MQRKYVTAMSRSIFDAYGHNMLKTFCQYWPKGEMVVYCEEGELPFKDKRVYYKPLMSIPGLSRFLTAVGNFPIMSGFVPDGKNYRFNVNAFCRKAFSQMDAANGFKGHLMWVDADVITTKHIPGAMLEGMMKGTFIALMKRKTWHVCSSFVGWDCGHAFSEDWFRHYREVYEKGYIFLESQWDDAFTLERVCNNFPGVKDIAEHVTGEGPYNVFDDVFRGYAYHMKGNLKKSA